MLLPEGLPNRSIAVIGAQGTGKSTLLRIVASSLLDRRIPFALVKEVARSCPYPIGRSSNIFAQTWILRSQYIVEQIACALRIPVLLDRCTIDHYAYYRYWNGRSAEAEDLLQDSLSLYRQVYVMPPNPGYLVADGVRPLDPKNQRVMDALITENISLFGEGLDITDCVGMDSNAVAEMILRQVQLLTDCMQYTSDRKWSPKHFGFGSSELTEFDIDTINQLVARTVELHNLKPTDEPYSLLRHLLL